MPTKRALYAVLAWGAATATAMAVVWTGLDTVLPTATEGPHVATIAAWPVQDAATTGIGSAEATTVPPTGESSPSPSASAEPSRTGGGASAPSSGTPTPPSSSPAAGTQRRYSTVGGTAVLTLYPNSASLDLATPAAGYSARSWHNTDSLEVEFSPDGGGTVYEVIATWNGTSPQVQTYAVGG
ncbi:MAG TPA: hypothetical protein VH372_13240 [Actinospica sp.]|nr:hypothetical protein [Actinospica sp.]